ncbi:MAG: FAD-binding protein, partial [Deltaproteobacteria bacterium]|nr:FAD-binding protein [Deltaproteobacteria bacterium]
MRICFRDLEISLQEAITPEPALVKKVESLAHASGVVSDLIITRRILDVRRNRPRYLYVVECEVPEAIGQKAIEKEIAFAPKSLMFSRFKLSQAPAGPAPVVVGAGPAGLLCALNLAEAGLKPLIIERGKDVQRRGKDISKLYGKGILDPESNVCFGEGGAGTYSDGKLYTRVNDPRFRRLLESFVRHGANPDILINNRPHIGTDKLVKLLISMREHLTNLGATFLFDTRVEDFTVKNDQIQGVVTSAGDPIDSK